MKGSTQQQVSWFARRGVERDGGAPHTITVTSARIEQERGRG